MHKTIIPIFLLLISLYSCSGNSEKAEDLISKANALINEKGINEPQRALEYLNKAIELQPDNASAYSIRGYIYFSLEKYQQAIDSFNKAIQLNPTKAEYYNSRGTVYRKISQYEKAIEDFNQAILFDSNDAVFYNNRGGVHLRHGDKKIGCLDAERACVLKFCDVLEWAKKEGYCR
ncbi:MAG: TPR repeat-containing protein YrrB [Firmicutes bacterium ADurb.Bin080]|nr:MAG: TPR repeat-containing protein YrrB [Firmicutes bacterium ADurb.Bin080]